MTSAPRGTEVAAADWGDLVGRSAEANPFFGPVLAGAAITHLGGGRVRLAAAEAQGRLVALAPVAAARLGRIAPAVTVWTHRYGPLGTPLLDRDAPAEAFAALVRAMAPANTDRAILIFPDLPLDGETADIIRRFAVTAQRPVAEIGAHRRAALKGIAGDETPFRERIERRRRKEFTRQWRRLSERGDLTLRRIGVGPDLERAALAFLALEAASWKGRLGTSLASDPASRAFALAAMLQSAPGAVAIDEIALDGQPVAMLVSFRQGDLAVTWKIAHDEALQRFSPGVQVMLEASEHWLADASVRHLDSLAAPDHPMIDGLWPDRIRIGTLAIGPVGGSALFRLGVAAARAEAEARRRYRSWKRDRKRSDPAREAKA